MPEGVSCLRQLYERGAFYFLGAFLFSPAACSGLPLPPLRGPPPPTAGVGKFFGRGGGARSPLLRKSVSRKPEAESRKSALRPCAPLLVRGERATQWRGGIAEGTPVADSRQPEAGSLHYALAHPCPGVGGERLYTLLRPTACQGGEGHAVARGGLPKARRQPEADSR